MVFIVHHHQLLSNGTHLPLFPGLRFCSRLPPFAARISLPSTVLLFVCFFFIILFLWMMEPFVTRKHALCAVVVQGFLQFFSGWRKKDEGRHDHYWTDSSQPAHQPPKATFRRFPQTLPALDNFKSNCFILDDQIQGWIILCIITSPSYSIGDFLIDHILLDLYFHRRFYFGLVFSTFFFCRPYSNGFGSLVFWSINFIHNCLKI